MVISPITPLLQRDGFDIALISVELWQSETIVRLAALVDDPAAEESAFAGAVDQWVDDGREGAFPFDPGEHRFRDVSVSLSDDAGTAYALTSSAVGGTGRLFRGDWHFATGVPDEARRVVVEAVHEVSGRRGSAELTL
jgi:hypothetical protein